MILNRWIKVPNLLVTQQVGLLVKIFRKIIFYFGPYFVIHLEFQPKQQNKTQFPTPSYENHSVDLTVKYESGICITLFTLFGKYVKN